MLSQSGKIVAPIIVFLPVFLCSAPIVYAVDSFRERAIADGISRGLNDAEIVRIGSDQDETLGIFTESTIQKSQGGVVILHDLGSNPDSANVIRSLRQYLPDHGWSTLAVQMPVLDTGADIRDYYEIAPDANKRIAAGLGYLKNRNILNVALIGHGLGGFFSINYLAKQTDATVKALVTIGLPVSPRERSGDALGDVMGKIEIPFFDIYGNRYAQRIRTTAKNRKRIMKKNKDYRQLFIDEVDNRFIDSNLDLKKRVYSWLARSAPGFEIQQGAPEN